MVKLGPNSRPILKLHPKIEMDEFLWSYMEGEIGTFIKNGQCRILGKPVFKYKGNQKALIKNNQLILQRRRRVIKFRTTIHNWFWKPVTLAVI